MAKSIRHIHNEVADPHYRDGQLEWYGARLNDIADRQGTPLHLGSSEAAADSFRAFMQPFKRYGLPLQVYYSVKTHPLPAYLKKIHSMGSGFETVSGWEYRLLKKVGVEDEHIIHTGDPLNHPEELRLTVVATRGQVDRLISRLKSESEKPVSAGITINPHLRRGLWDITLNTGTRRSPLGFHPSSDEFMEVVQQISGTRGVELMGLHMHLGSAIHSHKPFIKGIDTLARTARLLKKHGITVTMLDIGGGFSLPNAPMMKVRNMIPSLFGMAGKNGSLKDTSGYLDVIAKHLAKTIDGLKSEGIFITTLAAEPGRILSGPTQLSLFTIKDIVEKNGSHYLLCDAGAMSISPMLLTERHRVLPLIKRDNPQRTYTVMGKLPSALDRISNAVEMPEVRRGDRIAVLDTGAYVISMNNTFNGPRPPIAWTENGILRIVRQKETEQGLYWDK
ncbi:hypothetical protein G3570_00270 [Balneolaceae bacterium YR4-1]|uniref:Diaminopimelate decarboxylase n=1 Tax=Halalkalibaculum roseum TaxID=2709311 RepID=A0A6M1SSI0_9BACT|nr:hypothetical protein [Halalkalibaculum roseum]NGP75048.1 hypothetical protein [Halalkalibaculum roseum]